MNLTVARKLHERRFRPSLFLTTGEVLNLIGSEGMHEALDRRWLVADDSGYLLLNQHGGKLAELEEACRCPQCQQCVCEHGTPAAEETPAGMPTSMREAFAAYGVARPSVSSAPTMTLPRQQTQSPTSPTPKSPEIGDDAMVVEDGKTFTGKVAGIGHDGRYRLSFGSEKPRMDREYGPNELRPLSSAGPNA